MKATPTFVASIIVEEAMSGSSSSNSRRNAYLAGIASAVASMLAVGAAHAADMPLRYKAPPIAAQVFSWSGVYVGGQVGYSDGTDHLLEYFKDSIPASPGIVPGAFTGFERKHSVNGLTGGGFAGVNFQSGYWVWGLEGDIEGGNIKGGWIDTPTGGQGATKLDVQGSLRGRIGIASDRILVYGTGGAAFGNISHTYTNLLTGIVETTTSVRTGWTAGGGVEFAIAPSWTLRGEYRYTDYGTSSYESVTSFPIFRGTQNVKLNTVRIGAAYKF